MTILQKNSLVCLLLAVNLCACLSLELDKVPCDSEIYCQGRLLHTVQMSKIFEDSKTFVDMQIKTSPAQVMASFANFMHLHNEDPSRDDVEKWVHENFDKRGSEFVDWIPVDHKNEIKVVNKIQDVEFKQFAKDLNQIWVDLGRKMKQDVKDNPTRYSIIYVPNGVIVPGGRFLEFYYWDSYWIILGLIQSEMFDTAKGMLLNFLSIIDQYDFIPNGGRLYYLMRSQPPLLSMMIKEYVDATNDLEFARSAVGLLEREFDFFMETHTVEDNGLKMAFYNGFNLNNSKGPRPESYREDYIMAQVNFVTEQEKENFYAEIKTAAESGMDFSSRWFMNPKDNWSHQGRLKDAKTRSIIPVELNAILYRNAKIIAEFYRLSGNTGKAELFEKHANNFYRVVNEVLWNKDQGCWSDFDMINRKHRGFFVVTNLAPLFYRCFDDKNTAEISEKIMTYIKKHALDSFPGGVPNTLEPTGEQWDYPNVWPCMQHMLVVGLDNLGEPSTIKMAENWAQKWVFSNYVAYNESKAMYEKYLAHEVGGHGGGGEYEVQKGFGWTNGVILDLLNRYGDKLRASETGLADYHNKKFEFH